MNRMQKEKRFTRKRWWLWLPLLFITLAALLAGGFVVWASNAAQPQPEALDALRTDELVRFRDDTWHSWYLFRPGEDAVPPQTGFIFYPGGRVDARAYAPEARAIAAEGYLVILVPMPLNLAVISPNRAKQVIEAYPEIEQWVIGGHSLGGSMAASFAHGHSEDVAGLVLWAAYPADWNDLSAQSDLRVASIYGTLDGLATAEQIKDSGILLPPDTVWVPIEGGNHAQFGWYSPQSGDLEATISHEAQSSQVVAATLELLSSVNGKR
jgi:hypothetical protein